MTLVMATTGKISSEFDRLRDASWLATAYTLGLCATQPMVSYLLHHVGILDYTDDESVRQAQ